MPLALVGASHRTAPIEVRERLHVLDRDVGDTLRRLRGDPRVEECVVLSTCNRTEYYLHAASPGAGEPAAEVMAERGRLAPDGAAACVYRRHGREAVAHLFRVTCGIDSLVLGEHQIQGQVRAAYERAGEQAPGSVGPVLHRLFQSALAVGGRVRAETRIGEGTGSIPAAATQLAEKVFGSLHGRAAAVLGAGEMGKLTLACLMRAGVADAMMASRTLERAERAARPSGARPITLERFWTELGRVEIVVASTAAPVPVLSAERVRAARSLREGPLVVLDIALPRDVEPEVGEIPGVFLYNIDDLQRVVDTAGAGRSGELEEAVVRIEAQAEEFWRWYQARQAIPLIRRLRAAAEDVRRREVEEALRGMESLAEEDRERIRRATRQLLAKLLHGPTVELRRLASEPEGTEALEVVRRLFGLDGAEERGGG